MQSGYGDTSIAKRIRCDHLGPGGWNCPCCGPAPAYRKKWMRRVKARLRQQVNREIKNILRLEDK